MARLAASNYPLPDIHISGRYDPATDPHEQAFQRLWEASKALPEDELVGRVLRWQRGDGYAFYLVTALKPLTLQHIPYGDNWTVEAALIRGLQVRDVQRMVQGDIAMQRLFERSKSA